MRKSLYLKMILIFIAGAIVSNIIVGVIMMKLADYAINVEVTSELTRLVTAVTESLNEGEITRKAVKNIFTNGVIDLKIYDNMDMVKNNSEINEESLKGLEDRLENDSDKVIILKQKIHNKAKVNMAIGVAKTVNGEIVVANPYIDNVVFQFRKLIKQVNILSTIIIAIMMMFIGKIGMRPVKELINATEKMAKGDFTARINIKRNDEIGKLVKSFNTMAQEIGSIEILRNDFISAISHEFKTPLMAIQGYSKLLKDEATTTEQFEYIDVIIDETNRLSKMSSNILLLNNIENESFVMERKDFRIDEQIRKVIMMYENVWSEKNITFNLDLQKIVYNGNEELMYQVFSNLVGNAMKFSNTDKSIDITAIKEDNQIDIIIKDYGKGIREDELKYIFDKFYKGDKARHEEGNGLGLSIVKKIMDLHNGQLIVNSNIGKGTEMNLKLN